MALVIPEDQQPNIESQQSPEATECRPVDLRIDRRDGLYVKWADGGASHYPLAYLRQHCPCAECRVKSVGGPAVQPSPPGSIPLTVLPANIARAVEFADAKLVGNYALQISWADGHSTGIYEFRYLRAISPDS